MSNNFDSQFSSFFSRRFGKDKSSELTWNGGAQPASDPSAKMDRIEQKIAEMELRAEAARNLTQDAHEREAQALESNARVEDELAALKRQAIEMRDNAKNTASTPVPSANSPDSAVSKIKLVVGEPKKWLPALIKKQSNLPKRLKD
jgi:hypothetical protein